MNNPNTINTKKTVILILELKLQDQLREMYAYEQALSSPGTFYRYPLTETAITELLQLQLILQQDQLVQLSWQGRKVVRDHL